MSVKPHENLYGAPQRDTDSLKMLSEKLKMKQLTGTQNKSLIKSNSTSNVKIFESNRRRKLKKLSGSVGKNSPYRAPVYQNYAECIKGLSKQGFLGFYKGNMYRQFGILFTGIGQIQIAHKWKEKSGGFAFLSHLTGAVIADMAFHPLHFIESRYILQNRFDFIFLLL